jgi:uroporphyrinogen-III synthase
MAPGRRVLVTRASHQGSALATHLEQLGAEPVLLPAIAIEAPSSFSALDDGLAHLVTFHWLLFTSANAVDVFAQRVPNVAALPEQLRVAAIGAATRRALEQAGLRVDLVPEQAIADSLATALEPIARQLDGMPTRFLLIRAEEGREVLPERLRAVGAEVVVAPAYRTVIPSGSVEKLRELFSDSSVSPAAITFTSSSSARNLLTLSQEAGVPLPETALRVSIGPVTSQTMTQLGIPPHAEAPEATVKSLAETTVRLLESRRKS